MEPIRRRKWNWLRYTLRRVNDSMAKQVLNGRNMETGKEDISYIQFMRLCHHCVNRDLVTA